MPKYTYTAIDGDGATINGELESSDANSAVLSLRSKGERVFNILEMEEPSPIVKNSRPLMNQDSSDYDDDEEMDDGKDSFFKGLRQKDKIFFYNNMSIMMNSGLTLLESIENLEDQTSKIGFKRILHRISYEIQNGKSITAAIKEQEIANDFILGMLESGEQSGELDIMFARCGEYMERSQKIKRQIISALSYPLFLFLMSVGVAMMLIFFLIPEIEKILLMKGGRLPPSTTLLLDISNFFRDQLLVLLPVSILAFSIFIYYYRTETGKRYCDIVLLKIPIVNGVVITSVCCQFCLVMSTLLKSGHPVLKCLNMSETVISNVIIKEDLGHASQMVLNGRSVSMSLSTSRLPRALVKSIAIGEKTGEMANGLENFGRHYDQLLERKVAGLTALIKPAMTIIVGGMVGFVYYSCMMAMTSL
jgi:type IV pilus assembly protein PilC